MARAPKKAFEDDLMSSLIDDYDADASDTVVSLTGEVLDDDEDLNKFGISIEEAVADLQMAIDDAVDFMESEFYDDWERAEAFYAGESDVQKQEGRSSATVTLVRDAVRMIKPNAMRIFLQTPEIVQYLPANHLDFAAAAVADAQTLYANQTFWEAGGYTCLLNGVHNTLLKNFGVLKAHREREKRDEVVELENLSEEDYANLEQMPDIFIIDAEADDVTGLFRCSVAVRSDYFQNRLDEVDVMKFFFSEDATCADDARVIGERHNVTVGEAIAMGLTYDDWDALDAYDVESDSGAGESEKRRGYSRDTQQDDTDDLSQHLFLLTEVYRRCDLDGTGIPQLYRFWLGGTNYEYLAHDRVHEQPYSILNGDPIPNTVAGRSIMDVLDEDQNVQTSLLRATCDNAHAANNRRLAVHDTLVNMADVLNTAIGAPIRFRSPNMIQEIGTESTLGAMLPLLQFLREQSETKAGITNAAMGLDPDALQSTDKEAVKNTIALAQGQIELFCRNIAETGLRDVFRKLLVLNLRYPPKDKFVFIAGQPVPFHQAMFNPALTMKVKVGTGTGDVQMRLAALSEIQMKQEQIMETYGPMNPLCTPDQVINTLFDKVTLMGVANMGRYFLPMTPETTAQLKTLLDQKAAAAQGEPPSAAMAIAEELRGKAQITKTQMENEQSTKEMDARGMLELLKALLDDDFRRDQLAQQLEIENAKAVGGAVDKMAVEAEQNASRAYDVQKNLMAIMGKRMDNMDRMQMQQSGPRSEIPESPQTKQAKMQASQQPPQGMM